MFFEKLNQNLPPAGESEGGFYHLGTITHLKTGSTITEFSFDAWGRRRDKDDWSYTLTSEPTLFADRGFTSHEFLADFNLYNMNGRLYDPVVGRFLSPDPFIQDPSFSQSYNRYSYALNNPLKYTDPTGESWKSFWNKIGNWFTRNNIQFQVGVNISGNGTIPFAGISGPNNFNVNTQNFVKQSTAGIQSINQQIAMFSRMSTGVSPEWNMPMQQFVGESPLAGGVASLQANSLGVVSTVFGTIGVAGEIVGMSNSTFRIANSSGEFSPKYYTSTPNRPYGWKGGFGINTYSISKVGGAVSFGSSIVTTGNAYYDIAIGQQQPITYVDAGVGTAGILSTIASYYTGTQIPYVGSFVAVYGTLRLTWDVSFYLGANYGPSKWYGTDDTKWSK